MPKIALVTGANSFLGSAIVQRFASQGYKVYASSRSKNDQINIPGVIPVALDITVQNDCERVVKAIVAKEQRIDVLVNNAGYTINGLSEDNSVEDYKNILDTNAIGAFRLIKEVVGQMKRQKSGKIINITSLNGLVPLPNFGLYSSSKHALEALGISLRHELQKYGIYVTNIAPGAIYNPSPVGLSARKHYKPAREKFKLLYFLLPMATREHVASEIVKVAQSPTPPARVITGTDAKIISLLYRILPIGIWDRVLGFIWNKK